MKNTRTKKLPWLKLIFAILGLAILVIGSKKLFNAGQVIEAQENVRGKDSGLGTAVQSPESQIQPLVEVSPQPPAAKSSTTTGPAAAPTPVAEATPLPAATTAPKYIKISNTPTGYLNVRDQPSISGTVIGKVYPGETHAYTATKNGWYKININSNEAGWIDGQYTGANDRNNDDDSE
ncbi:MAG: SH3 domain-containing protein [Candidatus Doudnabacteria bacterium]|nr:SH3 domain-containing protein [Candidatus Doudnabacteria bacterium]